MHEIYQAFRGKEKNVAEGYIFHIISLNAELNDVLIAFFQLTSCKNSKRQWMVMPLYRMLQIFKKKNIMKYKQVWEIHDIVRFIRKPNSTFPCDCCLTCYIFCTNMIKLLSIFDKETILLNIRKLEPCNWSMKHQNSSCWNIWIVLIF